MTSEGRVDGIFAKTDPWMQFDDDIAAVGPMGELLHRRAIDFTKRRLTEGTVPKFALSEIGLGIPSAKKCAAALVGVGLWIDDGDSWALRNWSKWQETKERRDARSVKRREAGRLGGHKSKHSHDHPGKDCEWCREEGWE